MVALLVYSSNFVKRFVNFVKLKIFYGLVNNERHWYYVEIFKSVLRASVVLTYVP